MTSPDNPYRPPSATVADIPLPTPGAAFGLPGATVDAGRGVSWISEGWTLFTAAPVMWIVALLIMVGLSFVLGLVPILGTIVSILIGPFFMAGSLAFAHGIARGEEPDLGALFVGLREKTGSLVAIAVLYLLLFVGLFIVFAIASFFILGGAAMLGGAADMSSMEFPRAMNAMMAGAGVMGVLLLILVFVGLMVLVLAAYWFAPGLVLYTDLSATAAMKESFRACLRNWLPFLVYGLLSILVLLGGMVVLFIGVFLISMPVLMASYYTSFRDIYGQKA